MTRRRPTFSPSPAARVVLLGSVFLVAACGLVYELVAGAVSSYIMGDAVTQFSLVIGVFLCAMGLGSYLAKFVVGDLLKTFIEVEIVIGLVGGLSSIAMFAVSAYLDPVFPVIFYSLCATIGILIGIEIPLLIRILKENADFSDAVSHVLAIDYAGALVGAILFPLVVLPWLGLSRASVVFGVMNLVVAAAGITFLGGRRLWISLRLTAAALILMLALIFSGEMVGFLEDMLYQDSVIYAKTTTYQRIVLTRWRDDIRLFLNGHIQFSAVDEARYHEALVLPAMELAARPETVLILGGGDGMAAREVLKYGPVKRIVLVDLDPEMTRLGRERPELVALNGGSMNDARVDIVNTDAMKYVENSRDFFNVIIVDLPDPNSESMTKLYSTAFYALCSRRLAVGGVMVTQATSPFFAPDAFWCIAATIAGAAAPENDTARLIAVPYHVHVPSFGEWGFVLAAKHPLNPQTAKVSVPTRFLTTETLGAMFSFGKDLMSAGAVEINRLDQPVLYQYYLQGWRRFNE
ncbi:MAG: polyamine aminopropyltransferase [Pseudomonadota bacterium]